MAGTKLAAVVLADHFLFLVREPEPQFVDWATAANFVPAIPVLLDCCLARLDSVTPIDTLFCVVACYR